MSSREASDGGVEVVDSVAQAVGVSNRTGVVEAEESDGTLGSADSQEDLLVTDEPSTPAKSHPPKKERTPCGYRGCRSVIHFAHACPMV